VATGRGCPSQQAGIPIGAVRVGENQTTWAQGQPILNAYAEFNALIEQSAYSPADKARMIQLPGLVGATD